LSKVEKCEGNVEALLVQTQYTQQAPTYYDGRGGIKSTSRVNKKRRRRWDQRRTKRRKRNVVLVKNTYKILVLSTILTS